MLPYIATSEPTTLTYEDDYGWTLLMRAAEKGHEAIVKILLATGNADINLGDKDGWTAPMYAARHSHEAIVEMLHNASKTSS